MFTDPWMVDFNGTCRQIYPFPWMLYIDIHSMVNHVVFKDHGNHFHENSMTPPEGDGDFHSSMFYPFKGLNGFKNTVHFQEVFFWGVNNLKGNNCGWEVAVEIALDLLIQGYELGPRVAHGLGWYFFFEKYNLWSLKETHLLGIPGFM